MAWADIETAIMAWVRGATAFDGSHVILSKQLGPRPVDPYALVSFDGPYALGGAKQFDTDYDATRDPGVEIRTTVYQHQEIKVSIQTFTVSASGTGCALDLSRKLLASLQLPSNVNAFEAAGIALKGTERARDLSAIINTVFEGRSVFEATFNTLETLSEYGTFIQSVEVTDETT